MLKRLVVLSAALGVFILVAGALLWLRSHQQPRATFTLSDGSVLTFQGATFGTNHLAPDASRWVRLLPKAIARLFNSARPAPSNLTDGQAVVIWFSKRMGAGNSSQAFMFSMVHSDGTETEFSNSRFYGNATPSDTLEGAPSAYPQREKTLRVRVYDNLNPPRVTLLGELTLQNPKVSRAPKISAPPLPQIAHTDDLEVKLVSLQSGPSDAKNPFNNLDSHARFAVVERGEPSTSWVVQGMAATDSTGNRLVANGWSGRSENGFEIFDCRPMLWPSETYKLRFEFSRKAEASFETNELWTIRGVAVPTNFGFTLVETQMNLSGFKVQFHGLSAPGSSAPWHGMMSGTDAACFNISPAPKGHRLTLLRVTNERGMKINSTGASYSDTDWGFGLQLTGSKTIDLTVALHRSRFVEFQAQPAKWDGKFSR
jgi:hypothetical protein